MNRKLVGTILIGIIVLLCVYSGSAADAHFPYLTAADVLGNPGVHLDENVLVYGSVLETHENSILLSTSSGELEILNLVAEPGDRVEVFGTLVENTAVAPELSLIHI